MKKKSGIFWKVIIFFSFVLAIIFSGYFVLDKLVVPKYFAQYGIHNISDLVSVVSSLYNTPKESKLLKNPYTAEDVANGIEKLQAANYTIPDNGRIDGSIFNGNQEVVLTDREFAGVCNKIVESGVLVDVLWNLNYISLLNMSVKELIVTPKFESQTQTESDKANLSFIIKMNTTDICDQISIQMDTPRYLLNMIIPETLYFSVSYDFDFTKTDRERTTGGSISINGRTPEQSEILINLFADFIFPKSEEMNLDKFIGVFGNILLMGADYLGVVKFESHLGIGQNHNGIKIIPSV